MYNFLISQYDIKNYFSLIIPAQPIAVKIFFFVSFASTIILLALALVLTFIETQKKTTSAPQSTAPYINTDNEPVSVRRCIPHIKKKKKFLCFTYQKKPDP
jgi:hypothetical protein